MKVNGKSIILIVKNFEFLLGLFKVKLDKVEEFKYGLMAHYMRDGGEIIRQMERAD